MGTKLDAVKIGNKYNEWTVIGKGTKPKYFKCRCSCGVEREVYYSSLVNGKSQSCGHIWKPIRNDEKYIGNRFGRLTVIKRVNDVGRSRYLCKCDCGNEIIVLGNQLGNGVYSCGCLKAELSKDTLAKIQGQGFEQYKKGLVENTSLYSLEQDVSKNNKTGYKGVCRTSRGNKYRAYINLRRKQINLGTFDNLEDAVKARQEAEEKYFKPILEKYKDRLE